MLTKEELDILEDCIAETISYYNQPCYYYSFSPKEVAQDLEKAYRAQAIIERLRDELE